jgi:Zn-dependent protease
VAFVLGGSFLLERLMIIVPLILSLSLHEWAHAASAYYLGDDTAQRDGRLTLDPTVHIDPLGTLLLPLLGIPFGWARPVPVNPARFRRDVPMRRGMMLTAAAGPFSNAVLALVCSLLYGGWLRFGHGQRLHGAIASLFTTTIVMNVGLAIFNMLPIPPLDGSRVVDGWMPPRWERLWQRYCKYAPWLLFLIIASPRMIGASILDWPMDQMGRVAFGIVDLVAGEAAYAAQDDDDL